MVRVWVSYGSRGKAAIIFLNSINQMIVVMELCCVFCAVGTGFLNNI
jgi:hypothetical protein